MVLGYLRVTWAPVCGSRHLFLPWAQGLTPQRMAPREAESHLSSQGPPCWELLLHLLLCLQLSPWIMKTLRAAVCIQDSAFQNPVFWAGFYLFPIENKSEATLPHSWESCQGWRSQFSNTWTWYRFSAVCLFRLH